MSADELTLALATKRAVQAAGGLEVCERETVLSDSQISRCCSRNQRDSITVRDAITIDELRQDRRAPPHILAAQARILGFVLVERPEGDADADGLAQSVMELTANLGALATNIREAIADGVVETAEARAALEHLYELDQASAALRVKLTRLAFPEQN